MVKHRIPTPADLGSTPSIPVSVLLSNIRFWRVDKLVKSSAFEAEFWWFDPSFPVRCRIYWSRQHTNISKKRGPESDESDL